jgi:hypothetical protein
MTRHVPRKSKFVRRTNERDFPHLVELVVLLEDFHSIFLEIDAFHRERHIPVRRGRSRYQVKPFHIQFCFPDAATAHAFRNRFGGECLTHPFSFRRAIRSVGSLIYRAQKPFRLRLD